MSPDPNMSLESRSWVAEVRAHTRRELASVGLRLARGLAARFDIGDAQSAMSASGDPLSDAIAFAQRYAADQPPPVQPPPANHPLLRVAALAPTPSTAGLLQDLLLLSCLPEAHEGFATLCRLQHPAGLSAATAVLALHWLEAEADDGGRLRLAHPFAVRDTVEDLLCHSRLATLGLVRLEGAGPWHSRNLVPGPGVWPALMARPPQVQDGELVGGYSDVPGLDQWLAEPPVRQAITVLGRGLACQIVLCGGDPAMRATRVRALLGAAHCVALRTRSGDLQGAAHRSRCAEAYTAACMSGACLWLDAAHDGGADAPDLPVPDLDWNLPIITSAHSERAVPTFGLPMVRLPVQGLSPVSRRAMWQSLLPQLGEQAGLIAARYPIDPDDARDVVRDLTLRQSLDEAPVAPDLVAECIRARTTWHGRPGIQRIQPRADWPALLLPDRARQQLLSAIRRVVQQIAVLDDWGFAQGRAERRGVRMLFFGPPGTGKTLAAEVMARELGVDLLAVDLASLVSKWIGETEKNLAAVFEVAERSRALLLFDEADALFARRTETQDAHDRYANLETAYLLQRLERYEGVAVLTTNLRSNLDKAFARRFEYIVEFPDPDAAARKTLWRLHLPTAAPLAAGVDLVELAAWYPISGAQIKNAALAAAFLAAAAGQSIHQHHFLLAVEREYNKAGRAHPGFPPHTRWPAESCGDVLPPAAAAMPPSAR